MKKLIVILVVLSLLIIPSSVQAANSYYVSKSGNNSDGRSWATAWTSFSNIQWSSILPGDTLYISGGPTSETYNGTLTVGASGSNGNYITIDVGANSPNPSGHSGTVIISGGTVGINVGHRNYIWVNGLSGSDYKLVLTGQTSNSVYVDAVNYGHIDYLKINNQRSRGIFQQESNHVVIRGNDIRTGEENVYAQTDGIYFQRGTDNIIENNTIVLGNNGVSGTTNSHIDAVQFVDEVNLTIRGNWLEWTYGRGNANSQTIMGEKGTVTTDWVYIYNNVLLGGSNCPLTLRLKDGGQYYVWNNTLIAQADGVANTSVVSVGGSIQALKNNVIVMANPGGTGSSCVKNVSSSVASNNGFWRSGGGSCAIGTNNVLGQPVWDITDGYRLISGSPYIDAGVNLSSYFDVDFDGVSRPQGVGYDIGAYEYVGSTPTSTPTFTQMPTETNTPMPTPTNTPTFTPIPTYTPTPLPTFTSTPTNTPIPTATSTPTPTQECKLVVFQDGTKITVCK